MSRNKILALKYLTTIDPPVATHQWNTDDWMECYNSHLDSAMFTQVTSWRSFKSANIKEKSFWSLTRIARPIIIYIRERKHKSIEHLNTNWRNPKFGRDGIRKLENRRHCRRRRCQCNNTGTLNILLPEEKRLDQQLTDGSPKDEWLDKSERSCPRNGKRVGSTGYFC